MAEPEESDALRISSGTSDRIDGIGWLAADDPREIAARRIVARLQTIAHEAAKELPFGAEPTEFERLFNAIARPPEPDDRA